ncbi:cyclic-di-AMP-binding protein CbpB [Lentilactobacillus laojiaonis]|uniref:cyclic-di-AMP-binding protein CbpB n=1 Tax=Lentilactobacillus laojiaonis TaxID=2883998 RepID=UPI001D0B1E3F|nr:cyclic-di-AMP-binding protein CbpB [Lentilactobacillus laojiaonis]UDM31693.1 CBS domain-containing protein [Lentilactobacillus laojiaonis]
MISKPLDDVMKKYNKSYIITGEKVATVNENNDLQHVFLVLTKIKYSKIPVLDNDNHFKGFISLAMITEKMLLENNISAKYLDTITVKDVMQTNVPVINDPSNLEVIMRFLVDENFLPVVDDNNVFLGIITRKEIFNVINFTTHTFDYYYQTKENKKDD